MDKPKYNTINLLSKVNKANKIQYGIETYNQKTNTKTN